MSSLLIGHSAAFFVDDERDTGRQPSRLRVGANTKHKRYGVDIRGGKITNIGYNNFTRYGVVNMNIVGDRMNLLRENIWLSQKDLTAKAGISQSGVNRYKNKQADATYETLLRYADFFDVSLD